MNKRDLAKLIESYAVVMSRDGSCTIQHALRATYLNRVSPIDQTWKRLELAGMVERETFTSTGTTSSYDGSRWVKREHTEHLCRIKITARGKLAVTAAWQAAIAKLRAELEQES
jgi:hypothetical protein